VRERLAAGGWRERIAHWVIEKVVERLLEDPASNTADMGARLGTFFRLLQRRVAQRVRPEVVGPEFDYFISGGAKLPVETAAFLFAIGLPIYEGYGSTETNCPSASNTPQDCRLGSVGKLYVEVEAKVDSTTRELLVRGPNVAREYLHCEAETAANWDAEGWYHTRDIAAIDADGFLSIEERLDHMLVLLNGENVSPVAIENSCLAISGIEAAIVIGDHRPALVALVALNRPIAYSRLAARPHGARALASRD
jgi:long-chain acyl-CoA synthetase